MSYILDALRKADAQRDRQRLPGLQAQPMAGAPAATRESPAMGYAIGGVLLVGVVSAGVAFWQGSRNDQVARTAAAPAMPVTAPAAPVAAPAPATTAPVAPAPEPARAIVPAAPIVVEVPAPPRPAPAAAAATPASAVTTARVPAAPVAAAAKVPESAAPAAVAQAAPAGVPAMAITGGVYSPSPAQRMLIVNGQVFNEGSEVAPGVKLEEVQRGRAVLNFRGQRWAVGY